jgi:hypothetical protein
MGQITEFSLIVAVSLITGAATTMFLIWAQPYLIMVLKAVNWGLLRG